MRSTFLTCGASQQQENSRRQQRRQDSIYARNRYERVVSLGNIGHKHRASTAGAGPWYTMPAASAAGSLNAFCHQKADYRHNQVAQHDAVEYILGAA